MIKKTLAGILIFYIGFVYAQSINRSPIPFEPEQVISRIYQDDDWNQRQFSFLVDTVVTSLPGIGEQRSPAVAFDGTNYFIVYTEYRHGTAQIYGIRVTPDGVLLDSSGIAISFASYSQHNPGIAFDNTNYFVVWQDYRDYGADIYGARISTSGDVLDPAGILIAGSGTNPVLAFDGTNYLIAWCRGSGIYGARVTQTGQVLDDILISNTFGQQRVTNIAFNGTDYLVVWEDSRNPWWMTNRDIYGARVSTSGIVLDTAGIEIWADSSCDYRFPSVACDSTNYLVVWQSQQDNNVFDIYGTRVNPDGIVLDTTGIAISTAGCSQMHTSIAFDGPNYFVVWHRHKPNEHNEVDNFDIYGARISTSGNVIDTMGIAISTADRFQCYPVIDFDGLNYLVVWQDKRFGSTLENNIGCARVNQSGQVLDPGGINLSTQMPVQQSCPVAAFDGTNYLVVWHDFRDESFPVSNADIYGIRVDKLGQVLDSSAIAISTAAHDQLFPAVAFDGTNYFVVWEDRRTDNYYPHIYGARVSQTGAVIDPEGIIIADSMYGEISPSIAFDGTNYLVAWFGRCGWSSGIIGTRVSQFGVVLDSGGFVIDTAGWYFFNDQTSIAYGADAYLVVWNANDIFGARVCTSGVVIDTIPIQISNGQYREFSPSVNFNGTNYFVVWDDERNSTHPWPVDSIDIYGARVSQTGIVLDTSNIRISEAPGYQKSPGIGFDGTDYLVVWEDSQNDSFYDIYGAKVNSSGTVINTYQIVVQSGDQFEPRLARGNNDQILIVYSGWTDSINIQPANTMRIWGKYYPFVGIEQTRTLNAIHGCELYAYPNPFHTRVTLNYSYQSARGKSRINIRIYDVTGRMVKSYDDLQDHQVIWYACDEYGKHLPAGIYFCMLYSEDMTLSRKIVMIK